MVEINEIVINNIISNFDFTYMLLVNLMTYLCIKLMDEVNGKKQVLLVVKRAIFLITALFVAAIYLLLEHSTYIIMFNSLVAAPVSWSWIFKPICKKLGIDYAKEL